MILHQLRIVRGIIEVQSRTVEKADAAENFADNPTVDL